MRRTLAFALVFCVPLAASAAPKKSKTATNAVAPMPTDTIPFPVPVVGPVTTETRYTHGLIVSIDHEKHKFHLATAAGDLTCSLVEESRIVGADKRSTAEQSILTGVNVRVYYVTGKGAEVEEVDILPKT